MKLCLKFANQENAVVRRCEKVSKVLRLRKILLNGSYSPDDGAKTSIFRNLLGEDAKGLLGGRAARTGLRWPL